MSKKDKETKDNGAVATQTPERVVMTPELAKTFSDEELASTTKALEAKADEMAKDITTKKYPLAVTDEKTLRNLIKYFEKNVKWNHKSLPTYITVYHGLKDSLKIEKGQKSVDADGNVHLNGSVISGIYQILLLVEGEGYFTAKEYLTILTEVGGGVTKAMQDLTNDNQKLRDLHTELVHLDDEATARHHGIKVEDTKEAKANSAVETEVQPDEKGEKGN